MQLSQDAIQAGAEMLRGHDLDGDLPEEVARRVFYAMLEAIQEPPEQLVTAALAAMASPPDVEDFRRGWRAAIDVLLAD